MKASVVAGCRGAPAGLLVIDVVGLAFAPAPAGPLGPMGPLGAVGGLGGLGGLGLPPLFATMFVSLIGVPGGESR